MSRRRPPNPIPHWLQELMSREEWSLYQNRVRKARLQRHDRKASAMPPTALKSNGMNVAF